MSTIIIIRSETTSKGKTMNIRILSLFLVGGCQLSAMEILVKPAANAVSTEKSSTAQKALEATKAFCAKILSRFEQGALSQQDVQELNDLVREYKDDARVLYDRLGQFFSGASFFSCSVKAYLQALVFRDEFEPSEKEQVGALKSFIVILMAQNGDKGLMVLMDRLDMLILCNAVQRHTPYMRDEISETESARGLVNPRSFMVHFVGRSPFCKMARELTNAQRVELGNLSKLEVLKKRRDAIKNFIKLKKLENIHAFIVANKHYFESVVDLVNARGTIMDNTLLHYIIDKEKIKKDILPQEELSVEIKYIVCYLIALGASIDIEDLGAKTVRELLCEDHCFVDIAAFVSGIHPAEQANMSNSDVFRALRECSGVRIVSPMREATEPDGKHDTQYLIEHYKSPLEREIEKLESTD